MKLDILAIAAHPDDVELSCGGTVAKCIAEGKKVGIIDLTEGEMGTRGSRELRREEAEEACRIFGASVRENMKFRDAFFKNDEDHQLQLIKKIRQYRPDIVLTNAPDDRHSDHGRAALLVKDAFFLSGLAKIETSNDGIAQEAYRPRVLYHFIQSKILDPDFVVDVSEHWDTKMKAIKAYKSQFFDPNSKEPETFISSPGFMKMIEARGIEWGHAIGAQYGEGFITQRKVGVKNIFDLL